MGLRRTARVNALQMLYQWDLTREDPTEVRSAFWEVHSGSPETRVFADRLFAGTIEHLETIDGFIRRHAERWRLERMETLDRNLLRMAVEELLHEPETPPAVVIDEAVEIAGRYGTGGSAAFVNGVLDSIRKDLEQARREETSGSRDGV